MKLITNLLLIASIVCNFMFVYYLSQTYVWLDKKIVYDMDKVRFRYEKDTEYFFMSGCREALNKYQIDNMLMNPIYDNEELCNKLFKNSYWEGRVRDGIFDLGKNY